MAKKIGDLLSVGLVLVGLWILTGSKLLGTLGATITIAVEGYYLYQSWSK